MNPGDGMLESDVVYKGGMLDLDMESTLRGAALRRVVERGEQHQGCRAQTSWNGLLSPRQGFWCVVSILVLGIERVSRGQGVKGRE